MKSKTTKSVMVMRGVDHHPDQYQIIVVHNNHIIDQ